MGWIQRLSFLTSSKGVENLRALRAPADGISAAAGGCAAERWPWIESLSPVGPPGREARGGPLHDPPSSTPKKDNFEPGSDGLDTALEPPSEGPKGSKICAPFVRRLTGSGAAVGSDRRNRWPSVRFRVPVGPLGVKEGEVAVPRGSHTR
jgi:hypothetical protein